MIEFDLTEILRAWPYDPENVTANIRKTTAPDGRPILQVREPLGLQQMDYEGRPDGQRPQDRTTWLEGFEVREAADPQLELSHEDCLLLMQEGILFYQRYLLLYQIEDWEGVARDTARNLRYFDFVKRRAADPDDSKAIEQYRPYVVRIHAIAQSQIHWKARRYDLAIQTLEEALTKIRMLETIETPVFSTEMDKSTQHLRQLIEEFRKRRPLSRIEVLRRRKEEAVQAEDFELAARLRDEIRALELELAENK